MRFRSTREQPTLVCCATRTRDPVRGALALGGDPSCASCVPGHYVASRFRKALRIACYACKEGPFGTPSTNKPPMLRTPTPRTKPPDRVRRSRALGGESAPSFGRAQAHRSGGTAWGKRSRPEQSSGDEQPAHWCAQRAGIARATLGSVGREKGGEAALWRSATHVAPYGRNRCRPCGTPPASLPTGHTGSRLGFL